ncbi:unnamed protein product [Umbelopsis vinacea]
MFKIFYRSKYEYASPLLLASEASLAPLQKLQDMLLKWVNYGHAGSSINHAMTGMPPIANRVQELGMRFQYFTKTMHVENPLRLLLTHLRSLPTLSPSVQRQLLYSLVQPSPMYQRYRSTCLPQLILPSARNRTLVDISLRIRAAKLRSYALRWRKNRLAANYQCICESKLTRGHISSCYNLVNHPIVLKMNSPFPSSVPTPSYNAIDHALNIGDINAFRTLLCGNSP